LKISLDSEFNFIQHFKFIRELNFFSEVRQGYEVRANKINDAEAKRHQAFVLQNHRLQQQQQQQLLKQQQQQLRGAPKPFAINQVRQVQNNSTSGLRISSVASLSSPRKSQAPIPASVNLPKSITISRVEPEISIISEQVAKSQESIYLHCSEVSFFSLSEF
jgi:hypothetical protein